MSIKSIVWCRKENMQTETMRVTGEKDGPVEVYQEIDISLQ